MYFHKIWIIICKFSWWCFRWTWHIKTPWLGKFITLGPFSASWVIQSPRPFLALRSIPPVGMFTTPPNLEYGGAQRDKICSIDVPGSFFSANRLFLLREEVTSRLLCFSIFYSYLWQTVLRLIDITSMLCVSSECILKACLQGTWGRDSVVGIATGYGLVDRGVVVRVPIGSRIFIFSTSSRPALGFTQPPIHWVPGALFPGVKRPGCEADYSQPVPRSRKCGSIHSLPHTLSWRSA
jgi:hypothetical protein